MWDNSLAYPNSPLDFLCIVFTATRLATTETPGPRQSLTAEQKIWIRLWGKVYWYAKKEPLEKKRKKKQLYPFLMTQTIGNQFPYISSLFWTHQKATVHSKLCRETDYTSTRVDDLVCAVQSGGISEHSSNLGVPRKETNVLSDANVFLFFQCNENQRQRRKKFTASTVLRSWIPISPDHRFSWIQLPFFSVFLLSPSI